LRVLDGPLAPLPCLSRIAYRRCADCRTEEDCEIRHVFAKVTISAREVLDRTSIADAIAGGAEPVESEAAEAVS
jgi:DNA-binding IscR family transcriptional regulator